MSDRELAFEVYTLTLEPLTELDREITQAVFNAGWDASGGVS
jgi:hypothetical protein